MRRGGAAPKVATGASKRSLRVKRLTVRELRNTGKAKHARTVYSTNACVVLFSVSFYIFPLRVFSDIF
jgi:hypothetical protein